MADVLPNDNDDEENRPAVLNIGHAPQPDLSNKRTPRPDHEHLDGSSFDVTSTTNQHGKFQLDVNPLLVKGYSP